MPAWFYLLRLKSGRLYPGATTDLAERWRCHCEGRGGRTTRLDPPVSLAYQETFETFAEGRCSESQVKRWSPAKKEASVAGDRQALRALAVSHDRTANTAGTLASPAIR